MITFFLGTHMPGWLADQRFADVPLFVSRRRLEKYVALPRAVGSWALDSGGFTELSMHGGWTLPPRAYAAQVRRYRDEIGRLVWAAPQDWMCEPQVLQVTGLTVAEHQRRTVENVLELRALAPDLPFIPVLQGFTLEDYEACVERYDRAGLDLRREIVVGLGTICRRQGTVEAETIIRRLRGAGIHVHAFGAKTTGLRRYAPEVQSADSLAWSFDARRSDPLPGCRHKNCANCPLWALRWRARLFDGLQRDTRGPC